MCGVSPSRSPSARTRVCRTHHACTCSSWPGPKPRISAKASPSASRDVSSSSHGRRPTRVSRPQLRAELLERAPRHVRERRRRRRPAQRALARPARSQRRHPRVGRRAPSRRVASQAAMTSVPLGHFAIASRTRASTRRADARHHGGRSPRSMAAWRLRARNHRRRLLARSSSAAWGRAARQALRAQAREGRHRHPFDPERRKHARDVVDERLVRDHDQHPVGPEALRIGERQVRDAVQAHRGLAAAGAPLNGHQARRSAAR